MKLHDFMAHMGSKDAFDNMLYQKELPEHKMWKSMFKQFEVQRMGGWQGHVERVGMCGGMFGGCLMWL